MNVTYDLPEFWAPALLNGDETSMEERDIKAMNAWLKDNNPGWCIDCSEESFFRTYHDAHGYVLACDCLTYTFQQQ